MHAINTLKPRNSLKVLLNRKFCFTSNQNYTKSVGPFSRSVAEINLQRNSISFKHEMSTLLKTQNWLRAPPVRNFSLTKAVFSLNASNRDKEKRQVMVMTVSLISALLLCAYLTVTMEHHQDYVIIHPETKK